MRGVIPKAGGREHTVKYNFVMQSESVKVNPIELNLHLCTYVYKHK